MRAPVTLPSLWTAICVLVAGALGFALPRTMGIAPRSAFVVSLALALLIGTCLALRPLETLPFIQRFAVIIIIGCIGITLLRLIVPLETAGHLFAPTLSGASVPLVMAVAWWMSPLMQAFMSIDGAPLVAPPAPTVWIGAGTFAALLTGGIIAYKRKRRSGFVRVALLILAISGMIHLVYSIGFAYTRQRPISGPSSAVRANGRAAVRCTTSTPC